MKTGSGLCSLLAHTAVGRSCCRLWRGIFQLNKKVLWLLIILTTYKMSWVLTGKKSWFSTITATAHSVGTLTLAYTGAYKRDSLGNNVFSFINLNDVSEVKTRKELITVKITSGHLTSLTWAQTLFKNYRRTWHWWEMVLANLFFHSVMHSWYNVKQKQDPSYIWNTIKSLSLFIFLFFVLSDTSTLILECIDGH